MAGNPIFQQRVKIATIFGIMYTSTLSYGHRTLYYGSKVALTSWPTNITPITDFDPTAISYGGSK